MKISPIAKVSVVFALLAGGVGYLLLGGGAQDAFVYSKLVNEVMASPNSFRDQTLRVEGTLRQGSIQFRESPCEWRFVIEKQGFSMPVQFPQCIVPDTFRDGKNLIVVVQGRLAADNHFAATEVVPRCPSKYEMQQRRNNGEVMPHAATAPLAPVASSR